MIVADNFLIAIVGNITANGLWLCVRWGFPALKPIGSTNFKFSTNDYR